VMNRSGVGRRYLTTWWVCPICDHVFGTESRCRGTAVWAHDETAAVPTPEDWSADSFDCSFQAVRG